MAPSFFLLFLVSSAPLMLAAAADGQGAEPCPTVPVPCGKVNISFPFAIVPEDAATPSCGAIGLQIVCLNNIPFLGYNEHYQQFQILDIFYGNASLLVVDTDKLELFDSSSPKPCHAPENNSSNKLGLPFSISTKNQNLIFYNCIKPLTEKVQRSGGLVETRCGNKTFARVAERLDESGSYFLEGCTATLVPVLVGSGKANASRYEELVKHGFLLSWQVPLPPPSGMQHLA